MGRSPIRNKAIEVFGDNGSMIIGVAHGAQRRVRFRASFLASLTGFTITAKCVEGANVVGDSTDTPMSEAVTPAVVTLPIINRDDAAREFDMVIPKTLIDSWDPKPSPDDPVDGFFSVRLADSGVGDAQQVFVPPRGIIRVYYSPAEASS